MSTLEAVSQAEGSWLFFGILAEHSKASNVAAEAQDTLSTTHPTNTCGSASVLWDFGGGACSSSRPTFIACCVEQLLPVSTPLFDIPRSAVTILLPCSPFGPDVTV